MSASQYAAVTVTSSATSILSANNDRRGLVIKNNGSVAMYVGMDASVTTSNGLIILPQDSWSLNGDRCWRGAIYGITGSSSDDVRLWEWSA